MNKIYVVRWDGSCTSINERSNDYICSHDEESFSTWRQAYKAVSNSHNKKINSLKANLRALRLNKPEENNE